MFVKRQRGKFLETHPLTPSLLEREGGNEGNFSLLLINGNRKFQANIRDFPIYFLKKSYYWANYIKVQ
jgi:hypothetical protein